MCGGVNWEFVAGVCHIARTTIVELDLLSENAVEVIEVDRKGVAHQIGLQTGDLITAINDPIVSNTDDLHRILAAMPQQSAFELTVIRSGSKLCFTVDQAT